MSTEIISEMSQYALNAGGTLPVDRYLQFEIGLTNHPNIHPGR
jgi:hypothetical protein